MTIKEIEIQEKMEMNELKKFNALLLGNCLCIIKKDFIDLQESDAVFVELSQKDLKAVKEFMREQN